jgi:hypothetical protein
MNLFNYLIPKIRNLFRYFDILGLSLLYQSVNPGLNLRLTLLLLILCLMQRTLRSGPTVRHL